MLNQITMSSKKWWFTAAGLFLGTIIFHAFFSAFDHDEIEHLHASWLVLQGNIPFVDFLEQHNPFIWYIFAPFVSLFNESLQLVFATRLIDLVALLSSLFITWKMLCRFYAPPLSKWLLFLLVGCFTFTRNMLEFRPDPWMCVFIFCAFYCWILAFQEKQLKYFMLSGLSMGFAVVLLQKALVFACIMIGLLSLAFVFAPFWNFQRKFILKSMVNFIMAFFLACLPFVFWINSQGFAADYWFWNFEFNRFFYLQASVSTHISWLTTFFRSVSHHFLIWLLGIAGVLLTFKKSSNNFVLFSIAILSTIYFLGFTASGFPLAQYFLPIFPLLCILAGSTWKFVQSKKGERVLQIISVLLFIESLLIMGLYQTNHSQKQVMQNILDLTSPADTIFAEPPYHPIFRKDASFFWYNNDIIMQASADYQTKTGKQINALTNDARRWENAPAKVVHIDPNPHKPTFPVIKNHLEKYKFEESLNLYLLKE